jgi:hypothetical protein
MKLINIFILTLIIITIFLFIYVRNIEYFLSYNDYKIIEKDYDIEIPVLDIKEYSNTLIYEIVKDNLKIEDYELEQLLNNFFKNKNYNYIKILSSKKSLISLVDKELRYMYICKIIIKDNNNLKNNNLVETWNLTFTRKVKDDIYKDIEVISFQKELNTIINSVRGYYDFLDKEYTHFRIKNQLGLFEPYNTSLND